MVAKVHLMAKARFKNNKPGASAPNFGKVNIMNKETKHTPGPWVIYEETYDNEVIARGIQGADGLGLNYGEEYELFSKANAHLIAAAPKMLEALEKQHKAVDWLLARVIELDSDFKPTKSPVWDAVTEAYEIMKEATKT